MNEYSIVFRTYAGQELREIGRANNIPYAIENAKRNLARHGIDINGIRYVSHRLVRRA